MPIVATREADADIDFVSGKHGWLAETEPRLADAIVSGTQLPCDQYRELCLPVYDLALRSS